MGKKVNKIKDKARDTSEESHPTFYLIAALE